MGYYREMPSALVAGAVTGALILGIAGRGATAVVSLLSGSPLNLSLRGVSEVVIVGTLVGAIGGVLLLVLKSVFRGAGRLVARWWASYCLRVLPWFHGSKARSPSA